jgi:hypothetical protein
MHRNIKFVTSILISILYLELLFPIQTQVELGYGQGASSNLTGNTSHQIVVGNNKDGTLALFSIGVDGHLYSKQQLSPNSVNWSDWTDNLSYDNKDIAVGNNKDGRMAIFSLNENGDLYSRQQLSLNSSNWSDWSDSLGGNNTQIAVGNNKDGSLALFTISLTSNEVLYKKQLTPNSADWGNWTSLDAAPII